MAQEYDHLLKIVLIGNSHVGKSAMTRAFADGVLGIEPYMPTIGIDFVSFNVTIGVIISIESSSIIHLAENQDHSTERNDV